MNWTKVKSIFPLKKHTLIALVYLVIFEIACYIFIQYTSILPIYNKSWLVADKHNNKLSIQHDHYNKTLGWDRYEGNKRPSSSLFEYTCASAFGDSFTHSDEVIDEKTWANILSLKSGCEVANYGVGGYGLDQTYLKIKNKPLTEKYVFIGIYQEMLRRSFAASWSFYAGIKGSVPKPYYHRDEKGAFILKKPPENRDIVEQMHEHHLNDRYFSIYNVGLPYSYNLLRALYYQVNKFSRWSISFEGPKSRVWEDPEAIELTRFLLTSSIKDIENKGGVPILLFLPSAEDLKNKKSPYSQYLSKFRTDYPELCTLDPFKSLKLANDKGDNLTAPKMHYNAFGNEIIATYINNTIKKDCGFELSK